MRMSLVYVFSMARATALLGCVAMLLTACSTSSGHSKSTKLEVIAAENVWGRLAEQVGGAHVHVTSLISNPSTDPHDYEPTPSDARAISSAGYVITNGLGYD